MWDLPGPGLKPVSPALAGEFLTTVPPGKSNTAIIINQIIKLIDKLIIFKIKVIDTENSSLFNYSMTFYYCL